jgi:hypothetical protein
MKSVKEKKNEKAKALARAKEVSHTIKIKIGRDKWTEFRIKAMRERKTLKEVFYTFVDSVGKVEH